MGGAGSAYTETWRLGDGSVQDPPGRGSRGVSRRWGLPLLKASGAVGASPVLSDPFIRQVELGEEEAGVWERFNNGGESVALSSDGNTALIGGGHAEWVYTRSGLDLDPGRPSSTLALALAWRCRATGTRR